VIVMRVSNENEICGVRAIKVWFTLWLFLWHVS
jgi:hypothetical protein